MVVVSADFTVIMTHFMLEKAISLTRNGNISSFVIYFKVTQGLK